MPLSDSNRRKTIYLRDGRLALQRDEIPLLSTEISFELLGDWIFQLAIPAGCSQHLLHTWQRMIHEPTYSQTGTSYQGNDSRPSTYSQASDPQYYTSYMYGGNDYAQGQQPHSLAGARVAFVGNNERGERRVVYLEGIREMQITIDSFQLDHAVVCFRCHANCGLDAILYINDGCDVAS